MFTNKLIEESMVSFNVLKFFYSLWKHSLGLILVINTFHILI